MHHELLPQDLSNDSVQSALPEQNKERMEHMTQLPPRGTFLRRLRNAATERIQKSPSLYICLLLLIGIHVLITIMNFQSGTWFSGWDNLHPEFNFPLNFSRALSAVWQPNQGLGTYGGHGYSTILIHTIILFVMSLFVPIMHLRFIFTFLCLTLGAVGVFFLLRKLLHGRQEVLLNCASLLAGLFYSLNFGTIQNFYIQLEAFIVHFAALPWLFLTLIWYLEKKSYKSFFLFTLVSLIATIQGFIPPLFFVYILLLGFFLLCYLIVGKDSFGTRVKLSAIVVGITIILNAYWFTPVAFYTFTRTDTYLNAYNNLSSTGDFILKNKKYGDLPNLMILKGFISEAIDTDSNNKVFEIFADWKQHLSNPFVAGIGYFSFVIIVLGIVWTAWKKHTSYMHLAFVGSFLLVFSLLATNTFPFTYVSELMQHLPVFKQAFRVAFTKFSIGVSFYYAIFFGLGVFSLLSFISRYFIPKARLPITTGITILLTFSLIFFSLPTFQGHFLYDRTQIVIPETYFQLFDFFKTQNKTERIANLPQGWNWGWSIYTWGYTGSGFLWYGIDQPIMDRAFDVWGKGNEQYYWELTYALYAEKYDQIDSILNKYQVKWVVFDKNVVLYLNDQRLVVSDKLEHYLSSSPKYRIAKVLHATDPKVKDIIIYEVLSQKNSSSTYTIKQMQNIGPSYTATMSDQAYEQYHDYYTTDQAPYDIYFPYRSLFSNSKITDTHIGNLPIAFTNSTDLLTFTSTLPQTTQGYLYNVPQKDPSYIEKDPTIYLKENTLTIDIPKIKNSIYDSNLDINFKKHNALNCKENPPGNEEIFTQEITKEGNLRFVSSNSENCYSIIMNTLPQQYAYFVQVTSRHIKGKQLQLALINEESKKVDIEYTLTDSSDFETNYMFIPPMKQNGKGYSIHFNNISLGKDTTINEVKRVTVDPIPYSLLQHLSLVNPQTTRTTQPILTYYQSYDPAWSAFRVSNSKYKLLTSIKKSLPFLFGEKLSKHVLVNNWANGWKLETPLDTNESVVFFFSPQYLERFGLLIMLISLLVLSIKAFVKRPYNQLKT